MIDSGALVRAARRRANGSEVAVVRVALAVIVAFVLDDAFIHPEPGTAAGDHLVSGLVPALTLILLAIAYPRMRAWWQAMLAGSVGILRWSRASACPRVMSSSPGAAVTT